MKALVITGVSEVELQDLEIPKYKDDEVLINVKYCGICGSDLPRALDGGVHSLPAPQLTLGLSLAVISSFEPLNSSDW